MMRMIKNGVNGSVQLGPKEFTDDCIFNEQMEQHHYNTYSSTQHSNARRTLYLALNKTGQPRKIQIPVNRTLGKLATYTKALTQTVAHDRVEQLISRLFGADHVRHGLNQLCETGQPLVELTAKEMRPRPVCGPQAGSAKGVAATSATGGNGGNGGGGGGGKKNSQQNASGKDEKEGLRQKKKKKRRKCREDEQHPSVTGKRNGNGGNQTKPGGSIKTRLVGASIVTSKLAHPKPASLTIARTVRPTTPFPLVTARPTSKPTTVSNDLQDTSQQQSDSDSELEMDDVLQPSAELVDELDELDEARSACHYYHQTAKTMRQTGRTRKTAPSCTLAYQQQQHVHPGSPTASSWHELLPTSSVSEQRSRYKALSCCSFLSLSTLVVYGATAHLLYL
uniref:Fibroblast growth factor n=1 Tax=Anopheles culicifacies TaxID=139723 RepID=A0A182MAU3_9DIPT